MRTLVIILAITIFCSCGSEKSNRNSDFKSFISDTLLFKDVQNKTRTLNFSQIEKGVDSFELRLWSSVATTDFNFLTILKYSDSTWHLTETRYWIENVKNYPNADLMMLDSSKTKLNFPTRSFEKIIDSIESFRIDLIPSQHQIAGFMDKTADGAYYTLEVATKRYYKLLSYHNPKYYEDSSNKRVVELLNFLERDLRAFVMN